MYYSSTTFWHLLFAEDLWYLGRRGYKYTCTASDGHSQDILSALNGGQSQNVSSWQSEWCGFTACLRRWRGCYSHFGCEYPHTSFYTYICTRKSKTVAFGSTVITITKILRPFSCLPKSPYWCIPWLKEEMGRWFTLVLFQRFGGRRRRCRWCLGRCWEWQRRIPLDSWCSAYSPWGAGCQKPKTCHRKENQKVRHLFVLFDLHSLRYTCISSNNSLIVSVLLPW